MSAALAIDGLSLAYQDRADVLTDVSLRIASGERVALVGPNGAGKSSLFLAIAGILKPVSGRIHLFGNEVKPGAFHSDVGLIFQHADDQLFCPTVEDDVAFGPRNLGLDADAVAERVTSSLAIVGASNLAQRPVHHLSGGEKRIVCIAGALALQPRLLLCDEPTSGLDLRNRRRLIRLLQSAQHAMLIASHDLEFLLEVCDRALLLDAGRIVADGQVAAVFGDVALMEAHGQERPHSLHPHHVRHHPHPRSDA